ncbi:hypothetical protein ACERK3_05510 [Phycisphaerales bacterium AB-hyl4]|uniref:Uncharacterized protein n=1 Tax=Natronomicrosphaera hydrolytica TaxID=3242702 RepID=A0ABV4U4K8_9BACT
MPSLKLYGGYPYDLATVHRKVTYKRPGNYALGHFQSTDRGKRFVVCYVGRGDTDLKARLLRRLHDSPRHTHFQFAYATSPKAAFESECEHYHAFHGSAEFENQIHPARPAGSRWRCPRCDVFDAR